MPQSPTQASLVLRSLMLKPLVLKSLMLKSLVLRFLMLRALNHPPLQPPRSQHHVHLPPLHKGPQVFRSDHPAVEIPELPGPVGLLL